jgi:hypothetical protein
LGVEHDGWRAATLQNKLAAVIVNAELAVEMLPPGEARRSVERLLAAAWSASDLLRNDEREPRGGTRLAHARRQADRRP